MNPGVPDKPEERSVTLSLTKNLFTTTVLWVVTAMVIVRGCLEDV